MADRLRCSVLLTAVGVAVLVLDTVAACSLIGTHPRGGARAAGDSNTAASAAGAGTNPSSPPSASASPGAPALPAPAGNGEFTPAYYDRFAGGLPASPSFFPIAVWQQQPTRVRNGRSNAANYKSIGINTFAGLWDFPNDTASAGNLAAVEANGMYALGGGDEGAAADAKTIAGMAGNGAWTGFELGDEQDMSTDPSHIAPAQVTAWASALHRARPARLVYNNFGKAFSLFPWVGAHDSTAGLRQYCAQIDVASSDYYAATDGYEPAGTHTPNYYGKAIDHVRHLCGSAKPAWGFIETGHPFADQPGDWPPYSANGVISAATIEQGVWSMLAHGANGIVYFVHDFYTGRFTEDGLFDHPAAVAAVARVDAAIRAIAPILNAPRQPKRLVAVGADATLRADATGWYVVAAENSGHRRTCTFTVALAAGRTVQVVGENRTVRANAGGTWSDPFAGWGHHVYKIG
jgi:hypothetical protein